MTDQWLDKLDWADADDMRRELLVMFPTAGDRINAAFELLLAAGTEPGEFLEARGGVRVRVEIEVEE